MPRQIINAYPRFRKIKSLIESGDYVAAVHSGLDFFRYVATRYIRKEVFNHQAYDGDDFYTREMEELLAGILRNEHTPREAVLLVQKELPEIESMEAYDDYCLAFFDHIHEAIDFRLADPGIYLSELDKQIARYSQEYKTDMANGSFELYCGLSRYDQLNDLVSKKIAYLKQLNAAAELDRIVEEYLHLPSVSAMVVDEQMKKGNDEETLALLDKLLSVYKEDGYTASEPLHLKKAVILQKRGDTMDAAEEYRRIFRQHLSNKPLYFSLMKALVPPESWDVFVVKAFEDIPHITDDDCKVVCDLIVSEQKYACLLKILKQNRISFERTTIFRKYAPYMSEEHQHDYTAFILHDLRDRLSIARSNDYPYIVDELNTLFKSCPKSKTVVKEFLKEIIVQYRNRPALLRALGIK